MLWRRNEKKKQQDELRNKKTSMNKGEKKIFIIIGVVIALVVILKAMLGHYSNMDDPGIPYYSTASKDVSNAALAIYKKNECKGCHSLWTQRDIMKTVPSPPLDGIGSIRTEKFFYDYLSSKDPQSILPTRLKPEFRMPSYAHLPEQDRKVLAAYLSSLKVKDWYLEETKKREYEKLTGKTYEP